MLKMISLGTIFKLGEFAGRIVYRYNSTTKVSSQPKPSPRIRRRKIAYSEISQLTAEVFERTGANFLTSLKIPFLNDAQILARLHFEGLRRFLRHHEQGRPCHGLSAYGKLGNFLPRPSF